MQVFLIYVMFAFLFMWRIYLSGNTLYIFYWTGITIELQLSNGMVIFIMTWYGTIIDREQRNDVTKNTSIFDFNM